jgi:hypothetical protein
MDTMEPKAEILAGIMWPHSEPLVAPLELKDQQNGRDSHRRRPRFIPTNLAQVDLGFLPFTLPLGYPTNAYRYVAIRVGEGRALVSENKNLKPCPGTFDANSSLEACLIKDNIHPVTGIENGLILVQDTSVWSAGAPLAERPPRYRYTLAIKHLDFPNGSAGYVEALPQDKLSQFSVLVQIPPNEMTLVSREAVNFEMCTIQRGAGSDPLKFNRCANSKLGAGRSMRDLENPHSISKRASMILAIIFSWTDTVSL